LHANILEVYKGVREKEIVKISNIVHVKEKQRQSTIRAVKVLTNPLYCNFLG
ncbi:34210_t:CDS:2, partial [Gigaspora margarita]